jgi:hypothetical protein
MKTIDLVNMRKAQHGQSACMTEAHSLGLTEL